MPYHVGAKGSSGCSGYPALKDTGEVMGCHETKEQAAAQIYAINRSEGNIDKAYAGCGCPMCKQLDVTCEQCPQCQSGEMKSDCCANVVKQAPCWDGYVQRGMKEQNGKMVPNCIPVEKILFEGFAKDSTKVQRERYTI